MPSDASPAKAESPARPMVAARASATGRVPAADRQRTSRFQFVDALRGIAALAVAWHHINLYGPLPEPAETVMPGWLLGIARWGWAGVPTFFVISGFVIAYSLRNAWVTPRYLGNFALRRSLRLDPSYWAMIVLALVLHCSPVMFGLRSPHENGLTAGQVLTHFVYLQNIWEYDNLSAGFWTLCIEMQFYLSFCVLLALAQRLSRATEQNPQPSAALISLVYLPLALASLFVFNLNEAYDDWIVYFFALFFMGVSAWWALDRRLPAWVFWGYAAAMAARFGWFGGEDLPIAIATGAGIYLVGRAPRWDNVFSWAPLQYLGRISYSLYLIHYPVSHIVVNAGHRWTGDAPWAACGWLVLSLVLSLVAAHFFYRFVEAPTARLASRLKPRRAGLVSPVEESPAELVGSGLGASGQGYQPSPA